MSRNRGRRKDWSLERDGGYWFRKELKIRLWESQNGRCFYCRGNMLLDSKDRNHDSFSTFDHVVPAFKGGCFTVNNIVLACQKCNHEKGCNFHK